MNPRPPAPEAGTLPPEPHPGAVSSNKPINLITTYKIMQVLNIKENTIIFDVIKPRKMKLYDRKTRISVINTSKNGILLHQTPNEKISNGGRIIKSLHGK